MTIRIAVFGIVHEAMLNSPVPLTDDTLVISRGAEVLGDDVFTMRGIVERLREEADVEIVPLLHVRCGAAGAFPKDLFEGFVAEIVEGLKAQGPFDGICMANHGACEIAEYDTNGDTVLLRAVREVVGPDVPMTAGMDHHGQLTDEQAKLLNGLSAFRTAPHRDDVRTGRAAAEQLMRILRDGLSPRMAVVRIPLFLPGERCVTDVEPARSCFAALDEIDARPGVLESSIFVGFAWNDRPWIGMNAIVIHESDRAEAERMALELAQLIWSRHEEFGLSSEALEVREGLAAAMASPEEPVFLSDSGDNVTAGAFGDLTFVLQEALALPEASRLLVPGIAAPQVQAAAAAAGPGATIEVTLGAEHVSRETTATICTGDVIATGETMVAGAGYAAESDTGPWAVIRFGEVTATFHKHRTAIISPAHLAAMGLALADWKAIVFKLGYLHPLLMHETPRHIMLMSDGTSNLDLTRLSYTRINRPAYPFDPDMEWTAESGLLPA
ncbi:M81 family metallopeptidase [Pseudoroseicyclus sp. H15]